MGQMSTISPALVVLSAVVWGGCGQKEEGAGPSEETGNASGGAVHHGSGDGSGSGDGDGDGGGARPDDGDGDGARPGDGDGDRPGDGDAGGSGGALWSSGGGIGCEELALCGEQGDQDCCARAVVPGGSFLMGRGSGTDACPDGQACTAHEGPEHEVTISRFELDVYEVTVGRFRAFVQAYDSWSPAQTDGAHPQITGSGFLSDFDQYLPESSADLRESLACNAGATWTETPGSHEAYPQNCVNWATAFVFCTWNGGRLPTEAEWEFAAAGGEENRLYAWGSAAPNAQRASFFPSELSVVGTRPEGAARFGHQDLSGHLWEWTLDWLDTGWYAGGGATCVDCARVTTGTHRVLRGGAYSYETTTLRGAARSGQTPDTKDRAIGFRCAYDVD